MATMQTIFVEDYSACRFGKTIPTQTPYEDQDMIPPCLNELPQPSANIWHSTNPFLEQTALY